MGAIVEPLCCAKIGEDEGMLCVRGSSSSAIWGSDCRDFLLFRIGVPWTDRFR